MKFLVLISIIFGLSSLALAGKKKTYKASKRKPAQARVMENSKGEIELILSQFQDREGAFIKLIKKIGVSRYKVDVESIRGFCVGSKFRFSIEGNKKIAVMDSREYACD